MKYIRHNGEWVPASLFVRPPSVAPMIIRDTMDPVVNMADGRTYDSKSRFRETTRAHGLIEVGNERVVPQRAKMPKAGPDIARAWEMVEQGCHVAPLEKVNSGDFADVQTKIF